MKVQGDEQLLLQALGSLLDNAIKFNVPGGCVSLRVGEVDNLGVVDVRDTGIGIPADQIERIWQRFYQVDGSSTRRYGGMGVGLALVKDVIQAHGGAVWVQTEEGQGSTFSFALQRVT